MSKAIQEAFEKQRSYSYKDVSFEQFSNGWQASQVAMQVKCEQTIRGNEAASNKCISNLEQEGITLKSNLREQHQNQLCLLEQIVDAGALHLADEQSIRNMLVRISKLRKALQQSDGFIRNLRVPQTIEEAGLQIFIGGPILEYNTEVLSVADKYEMAP